jgi:hypothetical protein
MEFGRKMSREYSQGKWSVITSVLNILCDFLTVVGIAGSTSLRALGQSIYEKAEDYIDISDYFGRRQEKNGPCDYPSPSRFNLTWWGGLLHQ